jgi:hypothetical protein
MRGVHKATESFRSAIARLNSIKSHAVVPPIVITRESVDGHQFKGGNAQVLQIRKFCDCAVERALGCERPNVNFVEHVVSILDAFPFPVSPLELRGINDFGRAVYALWEEARDRVGEWSTAIDDVLIPVSGTRIDFKNKGVCVAHVPHFRDSVIGGAETAHREIPGLIARCPLEAQGDGLSGGGPETELRETVPVCGAIQGYGGGCFHVCMNLDAPPRDASEEGLARYNLLDDHFGLFITAPL